jgi:hypothetical protein
LENYCLIEKLLMYSCHVLLKVFPSPFSSFKSYRCFNLNIKKKKEYLDQLGRNLNFAFLLTEVELLVNNSLAADAVTINHFY